VLEWLKPQERFRHLFKEGNTWMLETIQKDVDREWDELLKLEGSAK
jgi:pyruvate ferredoxin oxidoreductase beta subunit